MTIIPYAGKSLHHIILNIQEYFSLVVSAEARKRVEAERRQLEIEKEKIALEARKREIEEEEQRIKASANFHSI